MRSLFSSRPRPSPSSSPSSPSSSSSSSSSRSSNGALPLSPSPSSAPQAHHPPAAAPAPPRSKPPDKPLSGCKTTHRSPPLVLVSSPVEIPLHRHRDDARPTRPRSPHPLPPSLAALLAGTDIPPRRRSKRPRPRSCSRLDDQDAALTEKDLTTWALTPQPLHLLLAPPDDVADDDVSTSDCSPNSADLIVTPSSCDSLPSLGGASFATDNTASSIGTPASLSLSLPRRKSSLARRSIEPIRSPPDAAHDNHPLAPGLVDLDLDQDDLLSSPQSAPASSVKPPLRQPLEPLRSAFKSNLSASLRALRSAARSFSSLNFPSALPNDLLTRSLLTIDKNVPYMDEPRPLVTGEMPSPELRRYLNPTTGRHLNTASPLTSSTFSASIQMQTYKVQPRHSALSSSSSAASPSPSVGTTSWNRSPIGRSSPSLLTSTLSSSSSSSSPSSSSSSHPSSSPASQEPAPPYVRQREMRENPDFIRIAVMEMIMRRRGKLDNQRPGRARWALPPRRTSSKPYEIGPDGVPARWTASCC